MLLALLLPALLTISLGQTVSQKSASRECYCEDTLIPDCYNTQCHSVVCSSIDSDAKVQCASEFLTNVTTASPDTPISCIISDSNLEVFPDDFFAQYPVVSIEFYNCPMDQVPQRLITPVCDTLINLIIYQCGTLTTIPEEAFGDCNSLKMLYLQGNDIENVPPKAFSGLSNLQFLNLSQNRLTSFAGLEGPSKLTLLDLSTNQFKSMDKDAFQALNQLTYISLTNNSITTLEKGIFDMLLYKPIEVFLEDNPLDCNCSLQWLQEWVKENDTDQLATCSTPAEVLLVDADFAGCPTSSANLNRNSMTGILATSLILMLLVVQF